MKKIILFLLFFFCIFIHQASYAVTNISELIVEKYRGFISTVDEKYSTSKKLEILTILETRLNEYLGSSAISKERKDLLRILYFKNNEEIKLIKLSLDSLSNATKQRNLELKYIISLKSLLQNDEGYPTYIQQIMDSGKDIHIVDKNYEFVEANAVKKIVFEKYYRIDSYNYKAFLQLDGELIYDISNKDYLFVESPTIMTKIPFSDFYKLSTYKTNFIDYDEKFIEEDGIYYSFNFSEYRIFSDTYGFYDYILNTLGYNLNNILFLKDNNDRFGFVVEGYQKVKLISKSLISNVSNKHEFLDYVIDDKKYITDKDTDNDFKELDEITQDILLGTSTDTAKIKKIYDWIVENISYTQNINLNDKRIFSGIDTYINKDGVCDGYTKLMGYMLLYANVKDIKVKKGFVIDVQDFPQIGHAWVQIGQYYYDPTFDDPRKANNTKKYKYYGLPQDIFYTNRFDADSLPEYLKATPLAERKAIVQRNLSALFSKYESLNYPLFDLIRFKKKYHIDSESKITISFIKDIIPYYEVDKDFTFLDKGKTRHILNLSYYPIKNDTEIELALSQLGYNLEGVYFFKWDLEDGTYEYRMAYNVSITE